MDIYNKRGTKITYKFIHGGDEIFYNFDERLFSSEFLMIEFHDYDDYDTLKDSGLIYKSENKIKIYFYESKNPYDYMLEISKEYQFDKFGWENNLQLELNLKRSKIQVAYPVGVKEIDKIHLIYTFGIYKLELESGKVKFNTENINYLEYLCKRFEDTIETVMEVFEDEKGG